MDSQMILDKLDKAVEHVRSLGHVPVYAALYGSQNYGMDLYTDEYQSDLDFKIIVMPTLFDMVFKKPHISKIIDFEGGQIDIKDTATMAEQFGKMNPSYLEILKTPYYRICHPAGGYMEDVRQLLGDLMKQRARLFVSALAGTYANKERQLFFPDHETGMADYNGKAAHHMYRLLLMLKDFDLTGSFVLHPPQSEKKTLEDLKLHNHATGDVFIYQADWARELTSIAQRISQENPEVSSDALDEAMRLSRQAHYQFLSSQDGRGTIYQSEEKEEHV